MRIRIVVYSCITGEYERIRHNQVKVGADYYMFSDTYERSKVWKYREPVELFKDPRRNARFHKTLPHQFFPDYDIWVWIDGSMEVKASIPYLVKEWMPTYDMVVFEHPDRNDAYEEATVVRGKFYDYPEVIDRQMAKYKADGFPRKYGLSETKIVMRYNTPKVREFNRMWFYELTNGSVRDQLSFDYCAWKLGMKVNRVPPMQKGQEAFTYEKHAEKRKETRYK
ncbi:MAG: DUF616 domain-containing protein [Alphaproteobacteria bacterium]|nr:DUF616 domain-containing protein [Alphaproteobacteria bacterium]